MGKEEKNAGVEQPEKKISMEELEGFAEKLFIENQQLKEALGLKRLEYLFRILENGAYFDEATLDKVAAEIKNSIIKEEEEK